MSKQLIIAAAHLCCTEMFSYQTAISSLMEWILLSPVISMTGTVVKDRCLPGHGTRQLYTCTSYFTWVFWLPYCVIWQWQSSLHLPAEILLLNRLWHRYLDIQICSMNMHRVSDKWKATFSTEREKKWVYVLQSSYF